MENATASAKAESRPYVFVCYAHDQRELVEREIEWLKSQGFDVWFDEAIEAGQRWSEDLATAIEGCAAVLFFVSPRSMGSRYCLDEIHFALECGRPIVPVDIEPVELTPGLRLSLGGTHRIFMHAMPGEKFRPKLASGLRSAIEGRDAGRRVGGAPGGDKPLGAGLIAERAWRPALLGVFAALVAFIAMMAAGP